jgi:hypothetical protein
LGGKYSLNKILVLIISLIFVSSSYISIGSSYQTYKKVSINLSTNEPFDGYTLFGPEPSKYTYLLDIDGKIVHSWKSNYIQGLGTYLLEDGELLRLDQPFGSPTFRAGGVAGRIEKFDNNSNLLWEFEYSNEFHCSHHDIEPLPNGNVLIIAWESKTKNEAIAAGRNPDNAPNIGLWPDHIIEVEPVGSNGGNIVWEWHVWDHLIQDFDSSKDNYGVVENHPELIDINFGNKIPDWTHTNSVDYNEELDQILLSVNHFNEIWVIDHSTTTEEAASHTGGRSGKGGDILYRWGNPRAYNAGTESDQKYFSQHGASWVEKGCPGEGNILVFNNGIGRTYSSVDEIVPPIDNNGNYFYTPGEAYGPDEQIWIYTTKDPSDLQSFILSNAQRLPNGNTLICSAGQGLFLEVTPEKEIVWKYRNILPTPFSNCVARIERYPKDYPGIPKSNRINIINNPIVRIDTSNSLNMNDGGLMDSAWSIKGHDTFHTGRSPYAIPNGTDIEIIWQYQGNFTIRVKAKDEFNVESDWGTFKVSMPKPKPLDLLLDWFSESFPILYRFFELIRTYVI